MKKGLQPLKIEFNPKVKKGDEIKLISINFTFEGNWSDRAKELLKYGLIGVVEYVDYSGIISVKWKIKDVYSLHPGDVYSLRTGIKPSETKFINYK